MIRKKNIKVGARGSQLSLTQVKEVRRLLRRKRVACQDFELLTFLTAGDKDKKTHLTVNQRDDFFTDTIDRALFKGDIDIAIHSAKDLPQKLHRGSEIFCLTKAIDKTDAFVGKVKFKQLRKGAKVGTSSFVRQNAIKALNPKVKTMNIRGTINERLKMVSQGKLDGVIVATAALKRLGLSRLIKDIMPWEATALQGQLAVVGRSGDEDLREIFSKIDVRKTYGKVTLVGAGPGDPDLITVKGIKALRHADCVFYDYLISKDLLENSPTAERIYVGKRKDEHSISQDEICRMLRKKAMAGKRVVRLKGGDPLIFGRGADEMNYLSSYHIDVEIIPGISSVTGIPSILGIPLTARGVSSSVSFISGHTGSERKKKPQKISIPKTDTVVVLMALTKLPLIVKAFLKKGWAKNTPVLIISKGTCLNEKIVKGTLVTIEKMVNEEKLKPPALVLVGPIVRLWKKKSECPGAILYTGTNPKKYKAMGRIIHHPMIEIAPRSLNISTVRLLLKNLNDADMIILTSRFGVKYFFEILNWEKVSLDCLKGKKFIVIGRDTAKALRQEGIRPHLTAQDETSEGLLSAMVRKYSLKGKKILFPRSALSNPFLKRELKKKGAQINEITVYQNMKPKKRPLPINGVSAVFFSSPSTVRNFIQDYRVIPKGWRVFSKGNKTKKFLERNGYESEGIVYE